mgnify:CR=1 FL=1
MKRFLTTICFCRYPNYRHTHRHTHTRHTQKQTHEQTKPHNREPRPLFSSTPFQLRNTHRRNMSEEWSVTLRGLDIFGNCWKDGVTDLDSEEIRATVGEPGSDEEPSRDFLNRLKHAPIATLTKERTAGFDGTMVNFRTDNNVNDLAHNLVVACLIAKIASSDEDTKDAVREFIVDHWKGLLRQLMGCLQNSPSLKDLIRHRFPEDGEGICRGAAVQSFDYFSNLCAEVAKEETRKKRKLRDSGIKEGSKKPKKTASADVAIAPVVATRVAFAAARSSPRSRRIKMRTPITIPTDRAPSRQVRPSNMPDVLTDDKPSGWTAEWLNDARGNWVPPVWDQTLANSRLAPQGWTEGTCTCGWWGDSPLEHPPCTNPAMDWKCLVEDPDLFTYLGKCTEPVCEDCLRC